MKQIKFTKKQVLDAIVNEPLKLRGGAFLNVDFDSLTLTLDVCNVCAVGAVMRECLPYEVEESIRLDRTATLGTNLCANEVGYDYLNKEDLTFEEHLDRLLEKKNYLGALSNYFEYNYTPFLVEEDVRMDIYNFVYATFPDKFTVEI